MKKLFVLLFAGSAILLSGQGCFYDKEEILYQGLICDTSTVTYSGSIVPILGERCFSCHDAAHSKANGGVTLDNYQDLMIWINNGKLSGAINQLPGYSPMPKGSGKIPDCEIKKIDHWIRTGSPNN